MLKVVRDYDKMIKASNFSKKFKISQSASLDTRLSETLRSNEIKFDRCFFNTESGHSHLDKVDRIVKYDYVWLNRKDEIVAFWDRKLGILFC